VSLINNLVQVRAGFPIFHALKEMVYYGVVDFSAGKLRYVQY